MTLRTVTGNGGASVGMADQVQEIIPYGRFSSIALTS